VEGQLHDLARAQRVPFDEVLDRVGLWEAAIKRLIEPEEIAALVGFLVSNAGAAITGTAQVIDAGLTAHWPTTGEGSKRPGTTSALCCQVDCPCASPVSLGDASSEITH
jgi:hypothetical protein